MQLLQQLRATSLEKVTHYPRFYALEMRFLTQDEYLELVSLALRSGYAKAELAMQCWKAAAQFGNRSDSLRKLQFLWQIECIQYFVDQDLNKPRGFTTWDLFIAREADRL